MPLLPLIGHGASRSQLAAAIQHGTLPQLLLVTGPAGVGKQRLGLWIAQRLFCEGPAGEPCGICRPCRLVLGLNHPDLHWMIPVPRPKAGESDKQVEELEDLIGQVLEERRRNPLYGPPEGLAAHFVATARLLIRQAALRPVEGQIRVFLVGHAERLVPQESSPEAANALLKLLEEPAPETYFILTAEDPESVLPTIRSRAIRMRLGTLRDELVRGFLKEHGELAPADIEAGVAQGQGSIGKAVTDPANTARGIALATSLLEAARDKSSESWELALKQTPFSARGDFTAALDALAEMLTDAMRGEAASPSPVGAIQPEKLLRALDHVGEARELAQGNVNPQLLLAVLGQELAETL
jgi:DNA polymerase-3 subunit delta'